MSPFEQLGLPADADERMVKRAYAQRLRDTRPDSDPEGFQRLHATYQAALALCQRKTVATETQREPEREQITPADGFPFATPHAPQEAIAFALERFATELLTLVSTGDATRLKTWLEEQPDLWSLRMKTRVGHALFEQFLHDVPPMSPACIEVLLAFFDMNQTHPDHDALRLQRLLRRMQLAWELQPAHRDALAERMELHLHSERCELDLNLERLARPLHWAQVVRIGLVPYAASSYAQSIRNVSLDHPEDLPEPCDQNQIRFWLKATDLSHVGKERLQLGAVRCTATLLGGLLLGLLSGVLIRMPSDHFNWTAFWWCVGLPAVPCALWGLSMLLQPLNRWHAKPEYQPARWPWLNLLLVPMLCAAAFASGEVGTLFALAALWLAFQRLRRRNASLLRLDSRLIWFGLWGLFMLAKSLLQGADRAYASTTFPALTAAIAMLIWGMDLWRQRHGLRVRSGMSR